jgi:hypothetical protein
MQNPIEKGTLVRITTANGGDTVAYLVETYRPTYGVHLERNGRPFYVEASRLRSIAIAIDDDDVMRTCEALRACGMSPLDRELWAEEHGRHYSAGAKRRLFGARS